MYDPYGSGIQILGIRSREPFSGSMDMSAVHIVATPAVDRHTWKVGAASTYTGTLVQLTPTRAESNSGPDTGCRVHIACRLRNT